MTEELITSLSGVRQLTVIARTSVMGYKGTTKKVKEIARELDVGSMLEGSVRKAGNRVRITAQLIDTATEGHLWAQNYDRELDDVFVVQSEIAEKVAGELKVQLLDSEKRTLEEKPTENMEAYTLYMKGKQLLGESTEANLRAALAHFTRATEIDPKFSKAYAGIAQTWFSLGGNGYEDFSLMAPKITAAARKSLELGPDFAEAHLAMGLMYMNQDLHEDQRAEIERAIQLNPNLAEAYPVLGSSQMVLSRLEDAIGSYENRYKLDPLSIDAAVSLSQVYLFAARQDESFALLQKALQLHPRNPTVYLWGFSYYYMYHGDYFKAQESIDRAKELGGEQFDVKWAQGLLDALMGKNERVAEQIEYFKGMKDESTGVVGVFVLASVIGDLDEAFKNLMRMAELHNWPTFIKYSRYFARLRADPRYIEFCRKVRMPP